MQGCKAKGSICRYGSMLVDFCIKADLPFFSLFGCQVVCCKRYGRYFSVRRRRRFLSSNWADQSATTILPMLMPQPGSAIVFKRAFSTFLLDLFFGFFVLDMESCAVAADLRKIYILIFQVNFRVFYQQIKFLDGT